VRPDKRKSRGLIPVPLNERPESRSDRKIDPCWQLSARAALLRRLALHYYQFHIGDYASHTAHLDELEDLAYRRMLDYCYLNEIGLPPTVEEIARLIRMRTHCERIANVLREFFVLHDDGVYRQFRVEQQIADFRGKSDKAKQAARKRWENTDANALPTLCERNANQEPITINQEPNKRSTSLSAKADPVPVTEIVNLYHQMLPKLPKCQKMTKARESAIKQRWREDLPALTNWENYFHYIGQSPFLTGRVEPTNGRPAFIANLEWITKASNYTKILEGRYHGV
jgi:uncharacterized protein YdaU (DUF1376 family)